MNVLDKLQPFVIGKSANPRCFRGIKKLALTYKSNKNFWMTATLFQQWFTIRNCFFRSVTLAVPDGPFLAFPSDEVPP